MADTSRRILLQGTVQGSGVRPELARLAAEHHWSGSVRNAVAGVELLLQGTLPPDDQLQTLISKRMPSSVIIDHYSCSPMTDLGVEGFEIVDSELVGPLATSVPLDRAICDECLRETSDPANRRFRYPFTTCSQCGPRFSILSSMPFDRRRTSMHAFEMCADCLREYLDPRDRRFHAQTNSCSHCGPQLWSSGEGVRNQAALNSAAESLLDGQIVALRGVGGYQLLVDATSPAAVQRLRNRKRRLAKPFAVLIRTMADALKLARFDREAERQLCSAANPIVLVSQSDRSTVAAAINPGLSDLGLLLPTTALHSLLLELVGRPLVCTSGNRDGEPLAYRVDDAELQLRGIADTYLHHNREILRPIDDSVVRIIANRAVTIRAARGIAPLPLRINSPSFPAQNMIACGGHQKGSCAIANGHQVVLGPHVGDLETLAVQGRWDETTREACELFQIAPGPCFSQVGIESPLLSRDGSAVLRIACDSHSGYFSSQWAAEKTRKPQLVWHHHAHIVAGMVEHNWLDREVLGVAWDGTGLGPDGTIWGGEFLRTTASHFRRIAHLRPFALPGGDAATADPRRIVVAVLSQLEELTPEDIAKLLAINEIAVDRIQSMLASTFSPRTTSCGRLFDVASFLILDQANAAFEGYAAMCLEAVCNPDTSEAYLFEIREGDPLMLDWQPVIRRILTDRRAAIPRGMMAMRFHRGLAQLIVDVACRFPELPVVLQGGVFQNRILVELVAALWPVDGQPLGLPGVIPPNDGGLAAGQIAIDLMSNAVKEK
jgi:hydrogenase maturation protein HypF